jgi:F-type H+-transporting ATPase subunit epsilon
MTGRSDIRISSRIPSYTGQYGSTELEESSPVANPFRVEIVSVEAELWSGEGDQVIARTTEGELAILAGHTPLLGQLKEPSRVRVKTTDGREVAYDVAGGFLSVTTDTVTILAEEAHPAQGEDPAQAIIGMH